MIEDYFDNQERKKKLVKSITIGSIAALITAIFLVLFLNRIIPLKQIIVGEETIRLDIGQTYTINYTLNPKNADNPNITFESSHPEIVKVDLQGNLKVNAYSEEDVIVTIKSNKWNISKELLVDINRPNFIRDIKFEQEEISINYGERITLKPMVTPTDGYTDGLTWSSSNSNLVSVTNNGELNVLLNQEGESVITISTKEGVTAGINVKVIPYKQQIKVNSIKFDTSEISLNYNTTKTLKPIISPENATNKKVMYTTSDKNLVTVDNNGVIKAVSNRDGQAIITVTTEDGNKTAQIKVKTIQKVVKPVEKPVEKPIDTTVKVSAVKINETNNTLYLNKQRNNTISLTATITPENATNKNITWSSSDQKVATIDSSGKVTPKALGKTTITVKTADGGKTATHTIYVKEKVIIVLSSTQGYNMMEYMKEYNASDSSYYSQTSGTLRFVFYSNTGFEYQYKDGFEIATNYLENGFKNQREYTDVSLFYTLTDPMVKSLKCDAISSGSKHKNAIYQFNEGIKKLKNLGYGAKGYVISHSPLNDKHSLASQNKIVKSDDKNVCNSGYSSNWKYYLSNNITKNTISSNNYTNLTYIDNWDKYLKLRSEETKTFNSIRTFLTSSSNPLEWDRSGTIDFMDLAFKAAGI